MKKISIFALCACFSALTFASAPDEDMVGGFSTCDASFFKTLDRQKVALGELGINGIASKDGIAYIKVGNRSGDEKSQTLAFPAGVSITGLSAMGYFDEITDLDSAGKYYYWGFFFKESPEQVAKALKPFISDASRLKKDGETFVRLDINKNGKWLKIDNPAAFAGAPGTGHTELTFIIEPNDSTLMKAGSRVSCSLQGAVGKDLLKTFRPDIDNP